MATVEDLDNLAPSLEDLDALGTLDELDGIGFVPIPPGDEVWTVL